MQNGLKLAPLVCLALALGHSGAAAQNRVNNTAPITVVPGIQQMLGHHLACDTYDIGRGMPRLVVRNAGATTVPAGTQVHWYLKFAGPTPPGSLGNIVLPAALPPGGAVLLENQPVNTGGGSFTCVAAVI